MTETRDTKRCLLDVSVHKSPAAIAACVFLDDKIVNIAFILIGRTNLLLERSPHFVPVPPSNGLCGTRLDAATCFRIEVAIAPANAGPS